ncbi:MAG: hypothetical protein WC872_03200, partial [Candidatus Absconditabacterales bacterium]
MGKTRKYFVNHLTKHHKKYLLGSIISGLLAFVITGFSIFNSNHQVSAFDGTWDNNNFITGYFWEHVQNDNDIMVALFGAASDDWTAYTTGWGNHGCNVNNNLDLNVVYLTPTDTIPTTLAANTIYVLNSGAYTITERIVPQLNGDNGISLCTAIIGSGDVTIYSENSEGFSSGMFTLFRHQYFIMDNLKLDGISNNTDDSGIGWDNFYSYAPAPKYNTFNNLELRNFRNGIDTYKFRLNKFNNIRA